MCHLNSILEVGRDECTMSQFLTARLSTAPPIQPVVHIGNGEAGYIDGPNKNLKGLYERTIVYVERQYDKAQRACRYGPGITKVVEVLIVPTIGTPLFCTVPARPVVIVV